MGHHHGHGSHSHVHHTNKRALLISFFLIFSFLVVELIGGILTNSLALISDAAHMLSDAAALGLSLLALKIGEKQANETKTYGYKRFEILAALLNGVTLLLISVYIFYEAYHRFFDPPEVMSFGMLTIAGIGLLVNILAAWILTKGDTNENLNLRSAFLHVLGDLLGSVGAIVAGLLILFFGWNIADPIASVLVSVLVLISGWRVTKESIHILMEGRPVHIDLQEVKSKLVSLSGVTSVHDLHIWSITSGFPALSCHLVVHSRIDRDQVLYEAKAMLQKHFGIQHSTIQIEGEQSKKCTETDTCN
ncbi:cation diffusion facilitator family transporter [Peribacillus tepidiphilus]|uniref:cation diffusion facilitator family transporter n=1 Tax=Peribacillus tepidiphilus TaxID=2652445 RepID=UPI0012921C8C|nr:cation diffusion facilitator family transporter [Peribacillus tepidiphilus]